MVFAVVWFTLACKPTVLCCRLPCAGIPFSASTADPCSPDLGAPEDYGDRSRKTTFSHRNGISAFLIDMARNAMRYLTHGILAINPLFERPTKDEATSHQR
ncbi:hypothetical protein CPB85DRAFT_1260712 [Mucidula mucida]|nr:hypothetical protein CPB85DRAFT_1260712 [Mucidula mucida]